MELTLLDVAFALELSSRGGGLRGGSYVSGAHWPRLRSLEYVPGVRVSARESDGGRRLVLRISGNASSRGTLVLAQDGRVTGRLGGLRISARLKVRAADLR